VKTNAKFLVPVTAVLFALCARPVMAQSTIFTVPNTDTVPKGKVDLRFDWLALANGDGDRLHTLNPRIVVGVGGNIEIGANVPTNLSHNGTNAFFQPNIKWKFASNDARGLAAAVGGVFVTRVNNRGGGATDNYGLVYGNFSVRVTSGSFGPRFTAGPYGVVTDGQVWDGPKAGAILGYEQPIHSRASIIADWTSGKNEIGYFTPGMSFRIPVIGSLKGGYSFGNDGHRDNRFLFVSYGITL